MVSVAIEMSLPPSARYITEPQNIARPIENPAIMKIAMKNMQKRKGSNISNTLFALCMCVHFIALTGKSIPHIIETAEGYD